jgi:hypothetical protein
MSLIRLPVLSPLFLWIGVVIICACPSLYRHTPATASSRQHRLPSRPCSAAAFLSPRKNNQHRLETGLGNFVFFNPDFIKMHHRLIFADVTIILPIQLHLNDITLKDVNFP